MARPPIGITADVHLDEHPAFATDRNGFNSRLMDGHDVVVHMARTVRDAGGKTLIVSGDWFHNRKKISVNTLHVSDMALRECRKMGVGIVALAGNHDYSLDGQALSLHGRLFSMVIPDSGVVTIDGYRIGCIPWTDDPATVRRVMAEKGMDFVIGHLGVDGSAVGPSGFEIRGRVTAKDLTNKAKTPVFLGHYHKPQDIPGCNACYVGSPLQIDWGEAGEKKRFALYREGEVKWQPLDQFPRFVKADESTVGKTRKQDFVLATVKSEKAKRAIPERDNVRVVVERDVEKVPPRMRMPSGVKDQVTEYMKYSKPPCDPAVAERVAMELLGESA